MLRWQKLLTGSFKVQGDREVMHFFSNWISCHSIQSCLKIIQFHFSTIAFNSISEALKNCKTKKEDEMKRRIEIEERLAKENIKNENKMKKKNYRPFFFFVIICDIMYFLWICDLFLYIFNIFCKLHHEMLLFLFVYQYVINFQFHEMAYYYY